MKVYYLYDIQGKKPTAVNIAPPLMCKYVFKIFVSNHKYLIIWYTLSEQVYQKNP